jgi:hypothetical protein
MTEWGLELITKEAFADANISEYWMNITQMETFHRCTVSRIISTNESTVIIPTEETLGSRFKTCTCGKPAKDSVPCKHMIVIVKMLTIKGLSRIEIMPYWWKTANWQAQYAADLYCRTDVSMNTVKATSKPENEPHYCPAFLSGNKKGWPKKNIHQKGVVDLIEELAKKNAKGERRCCTRSVKCSITTQQTAVRIL